jgi:transposase
MTSPSKSITVGVDTHRDTHHAAAVDERGRVLGSAEFPASSRGYAALLSWAMALGRLEVVGVEGTGVYGAGLLRFLQLAGVTVLEVNRPDRKTRRLHGKSDPVDAEAAARAALASQGATPKRSNGEVESIRILRVARRAAVKSRTQAANQMHALVVTAPEPLRSTLRSLTLAQLVEVSARSRPGEAVADPAVATRVALRNLARRYRELGQDIADLDALLAPLVADVAPQLLELNGVGTDVAGQLLVTAGQNADRLRGDAAFARLTGTAPLPASSGRTTRHRLSRGGDRAANAALHRIVLCRLRWHEPTKAYVARRTSQGLSKPEIMRCLKRYVAREVLRALLAAPAATDNQAAEAA